MLKCTINGKEVEVKEGTTIIQAMAGEKQDWPNGKVAHYCWHPGLSVAGVCRLCFVEIEGNPRVQIACNTQVTEGMKVNNTSDKVKDAAKWGLDFHLINHPLDCPICDQAGECGLQDQYMEYGQYTPEMAEHKVKKSKVVDLGPTVVLDSERCILCSRCVRFTDEVSKTYELGIFNRGDHSEIGTHDGKLLDNNYSLNTVDICPVGALTSKDFRFKQRVWYLKDANTVCNGCSTGCNVKVYFNKEGLFRVKPIYNKDVNGYWMCDEGRDIYKFANRETRLLRAKKRVTAGNWEELMPGAAAKEAAQLIKSSGDSTAIVVTGFYTNEEYEVLFSTFKGKKFYHWINNLEQMEAFDGILLRGDRNPNTKGLLQIAAKNGVTFEAWADLLTELKNGSAQTLIVAAPEIQAYFPDMKPLLAEFEKSKNLIWLSVGKNEIIDAMSPFVYQIPMKSYIEKEGTFTNFAGLAQKFEKVTTIVSEALTLIEAVQLLAGQNVMVRPDSNRFVEAHRPEDRVMVEVRKKNEFVFRRGSF